ncbi:MerR family transcriptional regulator [Nocardia sp. XZ_19_385]|uniref:MerR family transcriptional regulator n=1 Tax=Nocardia sp. XZ_19_385 TaxID=2769488 RepID=UPI00188F4B19|nr:MerR family transcriptional regulator [Nocardia sp. XZ_19_385]
MPDGPKPTSEHAGYSVRVVAERLGIPTATLRSWNQRYRIGPPQERPGRHRLYTEADIAVLTRMVDLIKAGATAAGAAATARGPALPLGDKAALLTAAFALESWSVCALLEAHLRDYGVVDTWDRLCRPAFADIVDRQLGGEGCVDVEHLLSWCIIATLHRAAPPPGTPPRPLVLACTSGETHSLPVEVLRAALAERGVGAHMLGPDVPTAALRDTLARLPSPATVLLWSQQEATALTSALRVCSDAGATVYVGGPGWDTLILPGEVTRIDSLSAAVEQLG